MRITRVESWTVPVSQEVPYAVAYGQYDKSELALLRLETDTGLVGYGTAGCDHEVTGETAEMVISAIDSVAVPMLQGGDPRQCNSLLRNLRCALGRQPSALACIDMAIYDLIGKLVDLPLWRLLGGSRDRIRTSITIGILPLDQTLESAGRWIKSGFDCLKLKGGLDVDSDIERVHRVRETFGDGIELRFDANQGYTVEESLRFGRATLTARVAFIEQPTPADAPELLGEVRRARFLPVMADECLFDAKDAFQLARVGLVDMLNVKLMKTGGIAEALQVEAVARAAGLEVMVGCMDESALGIAAGLHLALACPSTTYADLDGHLGLINDPAASLLPLENGTLYPPTGPGLGIEPRRN
ncbi:MAG: dipeptide epimerase [Gemmataceae bacterium]|nr:dipeptide epimerase [Gemmataceae bacterium]